MKPKQYRTFANQTEKPDRYSINDNSVNDIGKNGRQKVLLLASVASMIDQFNLPNIRLLQEMGYQVHVVCNFKEGNTCDDAQLNKLCKKLQDMHVTWYQWDCPRCMIPCKQCLEAYAQLWRLTGQHSYAWIHCHSPVGGALARMVAHKRGMRVVYTAHGFHFYQGAPLKNWLLYYPIEKLLSCWTDVIITINWEDYRFAVRKMHAHKTVHIPGVGIDVKKFAVSSRSTKCSPDRGCTDKHQGEKEAICKEYDIPKNSFLLLSVGELSRRKNQEEVIAALARMVRQDVYYLICGQGKRAACLAAYAKRLGVDKYVRFLGFQEDVGRLYRAADIFVFPSRQEGMPMALMEAMSAGMACVVSDIRGNRELIDGHCMYCHGIYVCRGGIRYQLGKTDQLQKALETMLEDGGLRESCGRYNRKRILPYSLETVHARMRIIYQHVAGS